MSNREKKEKVENSEKEEKVGKAKWKEELKKAEIRKGFAKVIKKVLILLNFVNSVKEKVQIEMDKNEIKIPVFDGVDYSMWKKRITLYLRLKKCNVAIERAKLTTDNADWDEKDLLAMNYIYSAITNKQMEFVCEKMTAYDIIKEFDSR